MLHPGAQRCQVTQSSLHLLELFLMHRVIREPQRALHLIRNLLTGRAELQPLVPVDGAAVLRCFWVLLGEPR